MKSIFEITAVILLLGVGVMWVWGGFRDVLQHPGPERSRGSGPYPFEIPVPHHACIDPWESRDLRLTHFRWDGRPHSDPGPDAVGHADAFPEPYPRRLRPEAGVIGARTE